MKDLKENIKKYKKQVHLLIDRLLTLFRLIIYAAANVTLQNWYFLTESAKHAWTVYMHSAIESARHEMEKIVYTNFESFSWMWDIFYIFFLQVPCIDLWIDYDQAEKNLLQTDWKELKGFIACLNFGWRLFHVAALL